MSVIFLLATGVSSCSQVTLLEEPARTNSVEQRSDAAGLMHGGAPCSLRWAFIAWQAFIAAASLYIGPACSLQLCERDSSGLVHSGTVYVAAEASAAAYCTTAWPSQQQRLATVSVRQHASQRRGGYNSGDERSNLLHGGFADDANSPTVGSTRRNHSFLLNGKNMVSCCLVRRVDTVSLWRNRFLVFSSLSSLIRLPHHLFY